MTADRPAVSVTGRCIRRGPLLVVLAACLAGGALVAAGCGRGAERSEPRAQVETAAQDRAGPTSTAAAAATPSAVPPTAASAAAPPTGGAPADGTAPQAPTAPRAEIGSASASAVDPVPVVERPPSDRVAAEAAVTAAVGQLLAPALPWDRRRDLLTGGEPAQADSLRPAIDALLASPCATDLRIGVRSVYFHAPTWASVTFVLDGPGVPEVGRNFLFGSTLLQGADGAWRARTEDTTSFVGLVGPFCGVTP